MLEMSSHRLQESEWALIPDCCFREAVRYYCKLNPLSEVNSKGFKGPIPPLPSFLNCFSLSEETNVETKPRKLENLYMACGHVW
jgi:hypothetical protein